MEDESHSVKHYDVRVKDGKAAERLILRLFNTKSL